MAGKWREAVWKAVQRRARDGSVTRAELIEFELDQIVAEVGSKGLTPHQTLSRELQELRDAGVLIFDGEGHYRIASGLADKEVDEAIATEVWRLQKARRGQGSFRENVMSYWHGACPLTGIDEPDLLRIAHHSMEPLRKRGGSAQPRQRSPSVVSLGCGIRSWLGEFRRLRRSNARATIIGTDLQSHEWWKDGWHQRVERPTPRKVGMAPRKPLASARPSPTGGEWR